jgi:hypothetical protein
MTPFQKLVLRALAAILQGIYGLNPYGTETAWARKATAIIEELDKAAL